MLTINIFLYIIVGVFIIIIAAYITNLFFGTGKNDSSISVDGNENMIVTGSNNSINVGGTIVHQNNSKEDSSSPPQELDQDVRVFEDINVRESSSKTLFDGKFVLGVQNIDAFGSADIIFNLNKDLKKVYAGSTTYFEIDNKTYQLVISEISYVGGYLEFNIYTT